nr:hypothetical protein [Escherichia coli]
MRIGEILFTDESKIILQIVKNAKCSGITHLHVVSISQVSVWAIPQLGVSRLTGIASD